ncbi:MAG: TrmH family RNA methyltransferase, partial [Chitinophagia bacterium]|nr:TrmH family RNA methyltransferase [Chitinophagia bacterium]
MDGIEKKTTSELGRPLPEAARMAPKNPIIVILDDVRSMHNVGSVFRTCDAFGVQEILLCGYTPQPPHRDIHKTALGATESVQWQHFATVIEAINYSKNAGCQVWAAEQAHNSINLNTASSISRPVALVFGNEVTGVAQEAIAMCDGCIEIPQWGA